MHQRFLDWVAYPCAALIGAASATIALDYFPTKAPLPEKPTFVTNNHITNNPPAECPPSKKPVVVHKHVHHSRTVILNMEAPGCRIKD